MTEERTTAYLLNELSQREAEEFEEQCFAQPEWPEGELESAEEDLVQAYIKEELSPERRRRFEEYYLTTGARDERHIFARSFLRVTCPASSPPQKVTWTRTLANFLNPKIVSWRALVPRYAAILLAVGLAAWLLLTVPRTKAPSTFADLNLVITSDTRGTSNQVKKVTLPLGADALRVTLTLPSTATEGTTYRVVWEELIRELEEPKIEKQDPNSLTVIIPADQLKPGQYTLKLYRKSPGGTEQRVPGDYLFDVE